jgi:hypothetical protein
MVQVGAKGENLVPTGRDSGWHRGCRYDRGWRKGGTPDFNISGGGGDPAAPAWSCLNNRFQSQQGGGDTAMPVRSDFNTRFLSQQEGGAPAWSSLNN